MWCPHCGSEGATGLSKCAPFGDQFVSAFTIAEIERGVIAKERSEAEQGAILRRWFEENVLPTFADRVLPFNLSAARVLAAHRWRCVMSALLVGKAEAPPTNKESPPNAMPRSSWASRLTGSTSTTTCPARRVEHGGVWHRPGSRPTDSPTASLDSDNPEAPTRSRSRPSKSTSGWSRRSVEQRARDLSGQALVLRVP
jgi:hypothetical protein